LNDPAQAAAQLGAWASGIGETGMKRQRKTIKRHNRVAAGLADPRYRKRVVRSKKTYTRKGKQEPRITRKGKQEPRIESETEESR
jgi:hypothetical protein